MVRLSAGGKHHINYQINPIKMTASPWKRYLSIEIKVPAKIILIKVILMCCFFFKKAKKPQ